MSKFTVFAIAAATSAAVLGGAASDAFAVSEINVAPGKTLKGPGVAVHGYDPVAYFTESQARSGIGRILHRPRRRHLSLSPAPTT